MPRTVDPRRTPRAPRRRRGVLAVVGLALGGLVLTGCTSSGGPPSTSPSTPPSVESPATDSPADSSPSGDDTGNSGGARGEAEIVTDIKVAVASVEDYWATQFADRGARFRPVRRVYAYEPGDGTGCGDEPNVARNAAYCPADDDIGFDVRWTAQAYQALGDAFVYYLIGHEYGHAVQRRLGTKLEYTIEYELQADCYAGAYLGGQVKAGKLKLEDGDIDELKAGLRAVADPRGTPWFDPRAHGTAEQRIRYFGTGFDKSLTACP